MVSRRGAVPRGSEYVVWWGCWPVEEWSPRTWPSSRTQASLPSTRLAAPASTWSRGWLTTSARSDSTLTSSASATVPPVPRAVSLGPLTSSHSPHLTRWTILQCAAMWRTNTVSLDWISERNIFQKYFSVFWCWNHRRLAGADILSSGRHNAETVEHPGHADSLHWSLEVNTIDEDVYIHWTLSCSEPRQIVSSITLVCTAMFRVSTLKMVRCCQVRLTGSVSGRSWSTAPSPSLSVSTPVLTHSRCWPPTPAPPPQPATARTPSSRYPRAGTRDRWTARLRDTAAVTSHQPRDPPGMVKLLVSIIICIIDWRFNASISATSVPFDLFVFSDTSSTTADKSSATGFSLNYQQKLCNGVWNQECDNMQYSILLLLIL